MKTGLFLFLILCLEFCSGFAQTLLPDKQGSFKIASNGISSRNDCGFTQTEISATNLKLTSFIEVIRKFPVLNELKGFDGQARIYSMNCDRKNGYAIPYSIHFEFCSWFLTKGEEVKKIFDPPRWDVDINNLAGGNFGYANTDPYPDEARFKQGEEATNKVNEMFFAPGKKETVSKGIDRYKGDWIVVYNPDRPDYWIPVTIREAYRLLKDYWQKRPVRNDDILQILDEEVSVFPENEKDGYAYSGGNGVIFRISSDNSQLPLLRVNPAYWNKNLPKSAIQFMQFYCPADKDYLKQRMEESLNQKNGAYPRDRFMVELNLEIFPGLIDK